MSISVSCIRLLSLNQPDPHYDTVCEDVRRFPTFFRLVLCLLDELGLHSLGTRSLRSQSVPAESRIMKQKSLETHLLLPVQTFEVILRLCAALVRVIRRSIALQ